jgi:hypothetical protein
VHRRLELAALAVAGLAVVAFAVSFVLGVGRPGARSDVVGEPAARTAVTPVVRPAVGRVEVLNASRRGGAARDATDRLRAGDFDVVYFGNAPGSPADSSLVIDRVGRPDIAQAAAARLGIARTTTQIDTTLYLDATVILGTDWPAAAARTTPAGDDGAAAAGGWRDRLPAWLRRDRSPGN